MGIGLVKCSACLQREFLLNQKLVIQSKGEALIPASALGYVNIFPITLTYSAFEATDTFGL